MTYSIRSALPEDQDQVVQLWRGCFPEQSGHNEPQGAFQRKLAIEDGLFFCALRESTIIGTVLAGYDGHRGWIYSLAVHPAERRKGLARALLQHAERALAARGCPKVNLQIRQAEADLAEFYQRVGYSIEQRVSMGKRL